MAAVHAPRTNQYWGRLYSEWGEFQFALVEDGEVLAEGNSVPVPGLPAGWDDALRKGFAGAEPDRLCALSILVSQARQREGIARRALEHMRSLALRFEELVAPVRPSWKHRNPLTPIDRYITWRRSDGLLLDPWLRTHERLGAQITGIAWESMTIPGTVSEWQKWTGMPFPETGRYWRPRASGDRSRERSRPLRRAERLDGSPARSPRVASIGSASSCGARRTANSSAKTPRCSA